MTLILSCITKDYAIQVSDRLFSYPDINTGVILKKQDNNNKCVLLNDLMSFGYAGLGEIGKTRTDIWLSEVLYSVPQDKSLNYILNIIRDRATEAFNKIKLSSQGKRHAFVGIGWTKFNSDCYLSPILVVISNYYNREWILLDKAQDNFDILISPRFKRSDRHIFNLIGAQIPKNEISYFYLLNRYLKRCAKKDVPGTIMSLLVNAVRKIASNPKINTVGESLLGVCLPKSSVMRTHLPDLPGSKLFLSGPPTEGIGTFLFFPDGQSDGVQYGPTIVRPSACIMNDFKISSGPMTKKEESSEWWDFYRAAVLTDIIGFGSWSDRRRPAIADDYSLIGYGDQTSLNSWPAGEPCPYYGALFGIKADLDIIYKIQNDNKYVMVFYDSSSLIEIPDNNWFKKLSDWFVARGMNDGELSNLKSNLYGLTRKEIIEKLLRFLKDVRRHNP
jgi:hypothetical protein